MKVYTWSTVAIWIALLPNAVISDNACGGTLSGAWVSGKFHTPNYPEPYLDYTECTWVIDVPEGSRVALKFESFEVSIFHKNCNRPLLISTIFTQTESSYDKVEIRDGAGSPTPIMVHSGSSKPDDIKSTTNHVTIKFRSDSSNVRKGFQASFEVLKEDKGRLLFQKRNLSI